ncbi:hypothetical protein COY27_02175 [Candidatus Woesearchaeota archaeon CG_4_10_14_0_2_um_filter_33_13]|nr:MAG: hypothetical protein COY27_02175 [Candidatus Woesearchaeota archaeon CG_4_10_14_0_2_um_filter_33_13]
MSLKDLVYKIAQKQAKTRRKNLIRVLEEKGITFTAHHFPGGRNYFVDLGPKGSHKTVVSSHYDAISGTKGANDNSSSVAVCIGVIDDLLVNPPPKGVRVIFFDTEETNLTGSKAYCREYGVTDISAVLNMELVGRGNTPIFWPIVDGLQSEQFKQKLQNAATLTGVEYVPKGRPPYLGGDQDSFLCYGVDAVCLSLFEQTDLALLDKAQRILNSEHEDTNSDYKAIRLLRSTKIMQDYHSRRDTPHKISESSLQLAKQLVLSFISQKQGYS